MWESDMDGGDLFIFHIKLRSLGLYLCLITVINLSKF